MKKILITACIQLAAFYVYSQSYLPIAGGTLTGTLIGQSANFNGQVSSGTYNNPSAFMVAEDANWAYGASHIGSEYWMQVSFYGTNDITRGFRIKDVSNNTIPFSINALGNAVLTGDFSGRNATFGGQVSSGNAGGYNNPNAFMIAGDSNWAYGVSHIGSEYWMQASFYGTNDATRGFRIKNVGNNTVPFAVDGNGTATFTEKVGIGTSSPDAKLTVKGKIHAEEVKVDLSVPGPDYVFEKEYVLKPLIETEKFISENKHLPEMPSAKMMEKEGVNLGEMQMQLLKKIEELTLYVIELKKENESQQKQINQLKSKH